MVTADVCTTESRQLCSSIKKQYYKKLSGDMQELCGSLGRLCSICVVQILILKTTINHQLIREKTMLSKHNIYKSFSTVIIA